MRWLDEPRGSSGRPDPLPGAASLAGRFYGTDGSSTGLKHANAHANALGPVGQKAAGLPAQRVAVVAMPYSAPHSGYERVLSEADVEQDAATGAEAARPAAPA